MNWSRFEYFLNAIFYILWFYSIKSYKRLERVHDYLLSPMSKFISKHLLSKKQKEYFCRKHVKYDSLNEKALYDKKTGINIGLTENVFNLFYLCYYISISYVLIGIFTDAYSSRNNSFFFIVITGIPGYLIAYKAVYSNHRYLKYYKKFEKKDERWHKKWRLISIIFRLGGVISIILGLYVCGKFW